MRSFSVLPVYLFKVNDMYLLFLFFLTEQQRMVNSKKQSKCFCYGCVFYFFIFLYKGICYGYHLYTRKKLICLSQHFDYNILMFGKNFLSICLLPCLLIRSYIVPSKCFIDWTELFDFRKIISLVQKVTTTWNANVSSFVSY